MKACYRVDLTILEMITERIGAALDEHSRNCRIGANVKCESADQLRDVLFDNHSLIVASLRDLLDVRKAEA